MKIVLLLLVVCCCLWQSQACSCLNAPFCQKFENAGDVIRGKIKKQLPNPTAPDNFRLQFEVAVSAVFKTTTNIAANTKIVVSTASNSALCGVYFEVGKEYLIFLTDLSTGLCSGTGPWESVTPEQKLYLRAPRACGTCATILCPPRSECKVDELGVASCVATCNIPCPRGQVCEHRPVQCIRAPCPSIPICVNPCRNKICGDFQKCLVYPPTGEAYCADTCNNFPCPEGQTCSLEPVICVRAPCPPRAVCTDPCANTVCGRFQQCQVYPPTGEAYCADTCKGYPCPEGQVCKLEEVQCIRAPCPPQATCSADPCAAVRCGEFQVCKVTDSGEAYCADTCDGRTCPVAGQHCELVEVQCVRAPCPPVAQCKCTEACIDLYDPVCGSDGRTYGNSCQLGVANCHLLSEDANATPITVVSQGECPSNPPTGCTTVRCSAGYVCKVDKEGNGYCAPSCASFPACPAGQVCEVSSPEVCASADRTSPCPPVAHCVACPEACIAIYQPVCGSDGNTYGNSCELQRHNCGLRDGAELVTVAHDGECCPEVCAAILAPVCGSDGNTYGNECELKRATCGASPPVTVAHEGQC